MAISFSRQVSERFVLVHEDGAESWVRIRRIAGTRVELEFDPGAKVGVYRQEVYDKLGGRVEELKRDPIRPIQRPTMPS